MLPNRSPPKPGAKELTPVTVDAAINAAPPETTEKLTTRIFSIKKISSLYTA